MITVTGLHKYFFRHKKNEIHVLNDMNITFPDKGLVVLLGASGSGKTTLLNVIGGLDSVQDGTIKFDDEEIKGYKSSVWDRIRNESIGYIFQNYNLLPHLSVYENIALVLKMAGLTDPKIIEQRVNYILQAVNMYPFRKKKSTQLSGGQQQRVAIARALVKNPRVIIADEPTGNLDSKNTLEIMNIIKEISKQKLVVLVTHERDLAKIYGDRIIEIKDGSVIDDYDNDPSHEHSISDDNIVYLKDMVEKANIENEAVNLSFYQDTEQSLDPIKVRLIVRNRTLYLDVDSTVEKIKLIDKSSNLIIKNEHFIKKNKEEMLETSFRTEYLENKGIKREYKTIVSVKQIIMLALQKIVSSSRKGKLMLFSFIMSGAVVAVVVAMAASSIIPDLSRRPFEDHYVYVRDSTKDVSLTELSGMLDDVDSAFINTSQEVTIGIVDPLEENKNLLTFSGYNDLIEHAEGRMVIGNRSLEDDEFIISLPLAESIVDGLGAEYGIWTMDHLMSEAFRIGGVDVKIGGIINTDISVIYTNRSLMNLINPTTLNELSGTPTTLYGQMKLSSTTALHGTIATGDQVMISTALYDEVYGTSPSLASFPLTVNRNVLFQHPTTSSSYIISGVYESDELSMIASDELLEQERFIDSTTYFVYTKDTAGLVSELEDTNIQETYDIIKQMTNTFNESMVEVRVTTSIVAGVVIGFALLGFYFVMHSSMVSRIYDIAVYRALGMKKSELMISFLIEILILSSVTSLIGYGLSAYALHLASDTLIGMFRLFIVTPISVFAGILIVYIINVLGGMLPILLLLRKTPAQILSQYDI